MLKYEFKLLMFTLRLFQKVRYKNKYILNRNIFKNLA